MPQRKKTSAQQKNTHSRKHIAKRAHRRTILAHLQTMLRRIMQRGYTVVELVVIIVIIGILAGIGAVTYHGLQRHAARVQVLNDITEIQDLLETEGAPKDSYIPELAGIGATPAINSAIQYTTNALPFPIYDTLTSDQNAELLLKICNETAQLPAYSTYIDLCAFSGNNINVKGVACTATIQGPLLTSADLQLAKINCNLVGKLALATATITILTKFLEQGGIFPVYMPKGNTQPALPIPEIIQSRASAYCLQAQSAVYLDIIYSVSSVDGKIVESSCSGSLPALDLRLYVK